MQDIKALYVKTTLERVDGLYQQKACTSWGTSGVSEKACVTAATGHKREPGWATRGTNKVR